MDKKRLAPDLELLKLMAYEDTLYHSAHMLNFSRVHSLKLLYKIRSKVHIYLIIKSYFIFLIKI
jgi:hypothetical protein